MNKLEQALRLVHDNSTRNDWPDDIWSAIDEALAEQAAVKESLTAQDPVAWAISHSLGLEFGSKYPMQKTKEAAEQMARQHMGAVVVTPLYAAPVRTKDLTDEEIWDL